MKTISVVARILLGLLFAVAGANGFLHVIPLPPPPDGPAGQFMSALFESGLYVVVYGLQLVGGGLLLANRLVPLALAVLAPIVVNIVLYHVFMAPRGIGLAVATLVLLAWLFHRERAAFAGLLGKAARP